MSTKTQAQASFKELYDRFNQGFAKCKISMVASCLAEKEDSIYFGTYKGMRYVGYKAYCKAMEKTFAVATNMDFQTEDLVIQISNTCDSVAGVSARQNILVNGTLAFEGARFSAIAENLAGEWKIVHIHYSFPVLPPSPQEQSGKKDPRYHESLDIK